MKTKKAEGPRICFPKGEQKYCIPIGGSDDSPITREAKSKMTYTKKE